MSDNRVPTKVPAQSSSGGTNPSAPSTGTAALESVQNESAQNPAAQEATHTHGDRSFRCADAVRNDCNWTVTGNNEDEILGYMRSHAREVHGKNEFTPKELSEARRAIQKRAA